MTLFLSASFKGFKEKQLIQKEMVFLKEKKKKHNQQELKPAEVLLKTL